MEIDYDEEDEQMEMADESQSVDDSDDDIEMNTEVSHSISLQSCAILPAIFSTFFAAATIYWISVQQKVGSKMTGSLQCNKMK